MRGNSYIDYKLLSEGYDIKGFKIFNLFKAEKWYFNKYDTYESTRFEPEDNTVIIEGDTNACGCCDNTTSIEISPRFIDLPLTVTHRYLKQANYRELQRVIKEDEEEKIKEKEMEEEEKLYRIEQEKKTLKELMKKYPTQK